MKEDTQAFRRGRARCVFRALVFLSIAMAAAAQDLALQLDPQRTTINFTLGDVLHTVRGTFQLKRGELRLDPASGKISGEIVVDTLHFAVPYEKWGMKNPSTLFLRVSESVDIDLTVAGSVTRP